MIKESLLNLPQSMTNIEKIEVALIMIVTFVSWVFAPEVSFVKPLGSVLMWLAALLLMQSLIRDLWFLWTSKKAAKQASTKESCLCMESAVGIVVVIIGAVFLLSGVGGSVVVPSWAWPVAIFSVLLFGLLVKDLVVGWRPWRIQRDVDHLNTHIKW